MPRNIVGLEGGFQDRVFEGKAIESREAVMDRLRDHRILTALIKEFQLDVTPKEMADDLKRRR